MTERLLRDRVLRLRRGVDRGVEALAVAILAVLVLDVSWQVATRFLLGRPSSFTEELARYLLIWLGLLGACVALRRGLHTGVDVLVPLLGERASRRVSAACVTLFGVAVLLIGGGHLVRLTLSLGQTSAALEVPLGLVYLALPVSGALVVFYALAALLEDEGGVLPPGERR